MNYQVAPIGYVKSSRREVVDDNWDKVTSSVVLDKDQFTEDALRGLDTFSHAEVIFYMDKVAPNAIERGARHPRERPDWPRVGIFAQRGKARPNQLGCTVSRILCVDGLRVDLEGLDAVDGTPVLDIKPWVQQFGPRGTTQQPPWMDELMQEYF